MSKQRINLEQEYQNLLNQHKKLNGELVGIEKRIKELKKIVGSLEDKVEQKKILKQIISIKEN